jgi:hypothetical protein
MIALVARSTTLAHYRGGRLLSVAGRFSRRSPFVKRLAAAAVPLALLQ